MKRFISVVTFLILTASLLLTGCSGELDRDAELKEAFNSIEDDISATFNKDTCDFDLLQDFLKSWSKNSDIEVISTAKGYSVLVNPATEGFEKADITTLQCSINTDDAEHSLKVLASALTALLGPYEHGDIRLIVTEFTGGERIGAANVDDKWLSGDNFINMQYSGTTSIYTSGPDSMNCSIQVESEPVAPAYGNAYAITMSMTEYADPFNFEKKSNYPNPIGVIGSMLATQKSAGRLFEVASFTAKAHEGYTPYTATAVVVIDSNNVENFTKRFDKSYSNMEDRFDELGDDFVYTMTETEMPDQVLRQRTADNLISLMYTLNTGICYQDEDSGLVLASAYIKSISTGEGALKVNLNIRARGTENLDELSREYEVTSGLCDMYYSTEEPFKTWTSSSGSDMATFFSELVPLAEGDSNITLKSYDNDIFASKNPKLNMISYTFEDDDSLRAALNIVHYMDQERN